MKLVVNKASRYAKMRAHTWIHLLYWALEKILNRTDIKQAWSYVDEDYWRLDFNSDRQLTIDEIEQIENLVNKRIYDSIEVEIFETDLKDAISKWAKAFFEEKYWDKVRVVKIQDADIELCWWTHTPNTSFIWAFKIISQEAVASWIKRLVIITWPKVAKNLQEKEKYIYEIAKRLDSAPSQIGQKIDKIQKKLQQTQGELQSIKQQLLKDKLKKAKKIEWKFNYIINSDDFLWADFKDVVKTCRENLNWSLIIYNSNWNFAIISDWSFSAKKFLIEKWIKWWWSDSIAQWRDKNIINIISKKLF